MKSKMRKKMIAFLLCMVLVICNSVSILADTPAEATTTVEKQTKQAGAVKETGSEAEKKEIKAGDADDTSGRTDSGSSDEKKTDKEDSSGSGAPETKTTEEKEDTTKATTEEKEDSGKADEVTTEEKKDSDKADEVTAEAKEESDKTSEATTAAETTEKDDTDAAGEDGNKTSEYCKYEFRHSSTPPCHRIFTEAMPAPTPMATAAAVTNASSALAPPEM